MEWWQVGFVNKTGTKFSGGPGRYWCLEWRHRKICKPLERFFDCSDIWPLSGNSAHPGWSYVSSYAPLGFSPHPLLTIPLLFRLLYKDQVSYKPACEWSLVSETLVQGGKCLNQLTNIQVLQATCYCYWVTAALCHASRLEFFHRYYWSRLWLTN